MSGERVSIARNEAEALWRPDPIYGLDYDRTARIKAYMRGRTAKPCDEQVEAVAAILFDKSWMLKAPVSWEEWCDIAEKDSIIAEKVKRLRDRARTILEAARKAVM